MVKNNNLCHKMAVFAKDQSGTTAIEYGLIVAIVFVGIVTAVQALGTSVSGLFVIVANAF